MTDVLPTMMALAKGGDPQLDGLDGFSFVDSIHNAETTSRHCKQYYEMDGNRGMYVDGWEIVARYDGVGRYAVDDWELYNLKTDPTQTVDLSSVEVERTAAMATEWEDTAWLVGSGGNGAARRIDLVWLGLSAGPGSARLVGPA